MSGFVFDLSREDSDSEGFVFVVSLRPFSINISVGLLALALGWFPLRGDE